MAGTHRARSLEDRRSLRRNDAVTSKTAKPARGLFWTRLLVGAATAVLCASTVAVGASSSASGRSASSSPAGPPATASDFSFDDVAARKWAFFDKYCSKCHNVTDWAGGIAFESLSPEEIPQDAETCKKAIRKLRGRLMPPAGNPTAGFPGGAITRLWLGSEHRHGGTRTLRARPGGAAPPESQGIRKRGPGPVGCRGRHPQTRYLAMTRETASTTSPAPCRCRRRSSINT